MFKFLNSAKTIIRQGKEICILKKEINDLKVDLAIQKSVKKQFSEDLNEVLAKLNISNKKLHEIKFILLSEQDKHIALEKIKNVINSDQTER